jgi:hypothetical protein
MALEPFIGVIKLLLFVLGLEEVLSKGLHRVLGMEQAAQIQFQLSIYQLKTFE